MKDAKLQKELGNCPKLVVGVKLLIFSHCYNFTDQYKWVAGYGFRCRSSDMSRHVELEKWLTSIITIHDGPRPTKPKIQNVPLMLRKIQSNEKCYEPLVVSLGPLYHGRPELQPMEKFKTVMANRFVTESKALIREVYDKVANVAQEAKECYAPGLTSKLDDLDFKKMMFLDGCFILQFMHSIASDRMPMKSNDIAFVNRDLFLLENQVPYVVLDALMSLRFKDDKRQRQRMLTAFFQETQALPPEAIHYLKFIPVINTGSRHNPQDELHEHPQPIHILDLARTELINERNEKMVGESSNSKWSSYRSAKELKTVGIHFRPSRTQSIKDVRFRSNWLSGTLWLPPLLVDDSTKSKLLNMVAYEACPDAPDDFVVTSYICLMDALIDQAEDVMVLRSKGILLNLLGSDQQVAELFNEIGSGLVPNPDAYSEVKKQIENHYKNKLKIWIAQWLHAHFSSPWTIFGLLAAIFVIGLTLTQTYFAAFPPPTK